MIESEKNLERYLSRTLQAFGGWSLKLLSVHVTGLPDRVCLLPGGKVVFVELKTTGKKPTKIQLKIHEKLRGLGFRVEVVDSTAKINDLIIDVL